MFNDDINPYAMKTHLAILFLLCYIFNGRLQAQQFSFGITPQALAPIVTDANIGSGWAAEIWTRADLSNGNGLELKLGYQQIGDYDSAVEVVDRQVYPTTSIYRRKYGWMQELRNSYLELAYLQKAGGADNRWLFIIGGRFSFPVKAKGRYESATGFGFGSASVRGTGFGEELLRRYDVGLSLASRFRLFQGCWLQAQAYQGFVNQWKKFDNFEGPSVYVTTLSAGLVLQLF